MPNLDKIKAQFEEYKCREHDLTPELNIIGSNIEILTCCQDFGSIIRKMIDDHIIYDSLTQEVEEKLKKHSSNPVVKHEGRIHPDILIAVNHINQKNYDIAIDILVELIEYSDHSDYTLLANAHTGLMFIYCKDGHSVHFNIEKANYNAKMALIFGEKNGQASSTLVENLEKRGNYHQAIELCKLLIGPGYRFSEFSLVQKHDFGEIINRLRLVLDKATDSPDDQLFTDEEKDLIKIKSIDKRGAK